MEWLSRWVHDLVVVVFFAGVAYLLLPENNLRPYARLVIGLVVIAALLGPALELLRWEPEMWSSGGLFAEGDATSVVADGQMLAATARRRVMEDNRDRLEAHVAGVVELILGEAPADLEVVWGLDGIEKVRVHAPSIARDDAARVARLAAGLLGLAPEQVDVRGAATDGQGGGGR